jgi:mannosyltransferase
MSMNSRGPRRRPAAHTFALALLTLLAFDLRVRGLGQESLWRDEIDAIYFALRGLPEALSMFIGPAQNGALYYLVLRPWLQLMGTGEFALRYPPVLFGAMAVPLTWRLARELTAQTRLSTSTITGPGLLGRILNRVDTLVPNAAVLAAALLAVNPYHLWYSQDGKMYALAVVLALLAAWFMLQANTRGGWKPWLSVFLVVSIAMHIHLILILLIPVLILWYWLAWPASRLHWRGLALTLAALIVPYLPFVWWQWDMLGAPSPLTGGALTPLPTMFAALLLEQTWSTTPVGHAALLTPFVALILTGAVFGFVSEPTGAFRANSWLTARRRHFLLVALAVMPVILLFLVNLRQPIFLPRYLIWTLPATLMLAAAGIRIVHGLGGRLGAPLALALAVYLVGFWLIIGWRQQSRPTKPDLRAAVELVVSRRAGDDLLLLQIARAHLAYRYYSSEQDAEPFAGSDERLGLWAAAPAPGRAQDDTAMAWLDREMRRLTGDVDGVWLLSTETETVDPGRLVERWLDREFGLAETHDFYMVWVGRYARR